ncbi:hypothetical protein ADUPG1_013638 [Aduncisulcus paluster]|uniref:FAD-binding FR-type domain-containing protein n=1 Tax=Aduncisulcus paluster TaxID=2918883 RepID=A0ABQ5K8E5_9EUKA|nr:hypothetical protein ADUPG1_013638 [Aduncisulcus paluster]|eukprot:gnl/Carplike_NY0171/2331_a3139_499.p1 GENE.gnl/Carplike_NY0171/2331_a3139_499~~gnl/Carplike_NY0171/2331_a3139_499.p1  ORF type:complete len:533 (-),score=68.94 gnl/Carplike_NY0171/2331_a3139_499:134-1699(-)
MPINHRLFQYVWYCILIFIPLIFLPVIKSVRHTPSYNNRYFRIAWSGWVSTIYYTLSVLSGCRSPIFTHSLGLDRTWLFHTCTSCLAAIFGIIHFSIIVSKHVHWSSFTITGTVGLFLSAGVSLVSLFRRTPNFRKGLHWSIFMFIHLLVWGALGLIMYHLFIYVRPQSVDDPNKDKFGLTISIIFAIIGIFSFIMRLYDRVTATRAKIQRIRSYGDYTEILINRPPTAPREQAIDNAGVICGCRSGGEPDGSAHGGKFMMMSFSKSSFGPQHPFTYSIYHPNPAEEHSSEFANLIRVLLAPGTQVVGKLKYGMTVTCSGPYGGFSPSKTGRTVFFVGGCGVSPSISIIQKELDLSHDRLTTKASIGDFSSVEGDTPLLSVHSTELHDPTVIRPLSNFILVWSTRTRKEANSILPILQPLIQAGLSVFIHLTRECSPCTIPTGESDFYNPEDIMPDGEDQTTSNGITFINHRITEKEIISRVQNDTSVFVCGPKIFKSIVFHGALKGGVPRHKIFDDRNVM